MAKNDKSFKPGKSGNPKGRPPKDESISNLLRQHLNKKGNKDDKKIHKELLVIKLVELAESGDLPAIKYVIDRLEGTPKQSTEITGNMDYVIVPAVIPNENGESDG